MTNRKTKILIADDHNILASGISSLLEAEGGIEIVGIAQDGEDVIKKVHELNPDLVIMDINMPKMNGIEAAKELKKQKGDKVKILILSMHTKDNYVEQAIELGLEGYVLKNSGFGELMSAIEKIMEGKTHYSPEVADILARTLRNIKNSDHTVMLSKTEIKILNMLSNGDTVDVIADALNLSSHTIITYKRNLFQKLDAKNVMHLIKIAIQKGYIEA